ncbi:hypothetical protein EDB85DRAFT_2279139 [Lactarius pseudohatsudake]|nr:hypothetical protein EDB85DRAFT_2279139 [Lactarius pseudohatsudake]
MNRMTESSESPTASPDVIGLTAPLLFGPLFNWALYGILCVQIYVCSYIFPNDRQSIKFLAYFVFLLETVQTALTGADIYYWFVAGFGDVERLGNSHFTPIDIPVIAAVILLIVQGYFCYRIWTLNDQVIVDLLDHRCRCGDSISCSDVGEQQIMVDIECLGGYSDRSAMSLLGWAVTNVVVASHSPPNNTIASHPPGQAGHVLCNVIDPALFHLLSNRPASVTRLTPSRFVDNVAPLSPLFSHLPRAACSLTPCPILRLIHEEITAREPASGPARTQKRSHISRDTPPTIIDGGRLAYSERSVAKDIWHADVAAPCRINVVYEDGLQKHRPTHAKVSGQESGAHWSGENSLVLLPELRLAQALDLKLYICSIAIGLANLPFQIWVPTVSPLRRGNQLIHLTPP